MSDSLALSNQIAVKAAFGGEGIDIPRYADLFTNATKKEEETPEQIIARFDKLRRRTT